MVIDRCTSCRRFEEADGGIVNSIESLLSSIGDTASNNSAIGVEVRLWLRLIAYNLGNLWRRVVLPKKIENWSLTSLQQRLVKTGGRLAKHARWSGGSMRWLWRLGKREAMTQQIIRQTRDGGRRGVCRKC